MTTNITKQTTAFSGFQINNILKAIIDAGTPKTVEAPKNFSEAKAQQRLKEISDEKSKIKPFYQTAKQYAGKVVNTVSQQFNWDQIEILSFSMRRSPNDPVATKMLEILQGYLDQLNDEEKKLNNSIRLAQTGRNNRNTLSPEQIQRQKALLLSPAFREIIHNIRNAGNSKLPSAGENGRTWQIPIRDQEVPCFYVAIDLSIHPNCNPIYLAVAGDLAQPKGLVLHMPCPPLLFIEARSLPQIENALHGMQIFALNFLEHMTPAEYRVIFIDSDTKNDCSLGILGSLTGEGCVYPMPHDDKEIEIALATLLKLQETAPKRRLLVFRGAKHNISRNAQEMLNRLVHNAPYNSLSVVIITQSVDSQDISAPTIRYLSDGRKRFISDPQGQTIPMMFYGDLPHSPTSLSDQYATSIRNACIPIKKSNAYAENVIRTVPQKRSKKLRGITFPYGLIDETIQYITMEEQTFAAYLMGSAGSGKTNALEVIIEALAGLYHPDDLEFWLADMGLVSFHARYKESPYPHIRYLLLDDSVESSLSFIEKLDLELERRKTVLIDYNVEHFYQLPETCEEAAILIIIDEFSVMSNALADINYPPAEEARNRLSNLLLQGRKHGMFFIFSNQNYTAGVKGFPEDAKNQIQLRLLMSAPFEEKCACAGIINKTPEQTATINNLSEHHILPVVKGVMRTPVKVFHMEEDPAAQHQHSAAIRAECRFREKDLMIIDPTTPCRWADRRKHITANITAQQQMDDWNSNTVLIYPGLPIGMDFVRPFRLTKRRKQNVLLLSPESQAGSTLSVLQACIQSCVLQNIPVEVWWPEDFQCVNRLYDATIIKEDDELARRINDLQAVIKSGDVQLQSPQVIIIPEMGMLIEQMEDYQQQQRFNNNTLSNDRTTDFSMDLNERLAQIQRGLYQGDSHNSSIKSTLEELLQHGGKYNIHFIVHFEDDGECLSTGGRMWIDCFRHKLLFRNGCTQNAIELNGFVRYIKGDRLFVHVQNRTTYLYSPFA